MKQFLAALRERQGKRPCDCESCDCGNSGDTYSVGSWDGANWILGEVEAMLAASPPAATEGAGWVRVPREQLERWAEWVGHRGYDGVDCMLNEMKAALAAPPAKNPSGGAK